MEKRAVTDTNPYLLEDVDLTQLKEYLLNFSSLEDVLLDLNNKISNKKTTFVVEYIGNYESMKDGTQYLYFNSIEEIISECFRVNKENTFELIILKLFRENIELDWADVQLDRDIFKKYDSVIDYMTYFESLSLDDQGNEAKELFTYINFEGVLIDYMEKRDFCSFEVYEK